MDKKMKKQAEEEMEYILELMEEWALKYGEDYMSAFVFVKQDEIVSNGHIDNYTRFNVSRKTKRTPQMPGKA